MNDYVTSTLDLLIDAVRLQKRYSERHLKAWEAGLERMAASQTYSEGLFKYMTDFMIPFWIALDSFLDLEKRKVLEEPPHKTYDDYLEMLQFNLQIARKGLAGSFNALNEYRTSETLKTYAAFLNI